MKEPVKLKVIIGFLILIVLLIPWYMPKSFGMIYVARLPLWVFLNILTNICLVGYLIYVISNHWDIERFLKTK